MMKHILKDHFAHPRDANIVLYHAAHKYEVATDKKSSYTSVTTWCHGNFPKFDADAIIQKMFEGRSWKPGHKYWGMSAQEIKDSWNKNAAAVSGAGTQLHERIECFFNNEALPLPYTHADLLRHHHRKATDEEKNEEEKAIEEKKEEVEEPVEWQYFLQFVEDHPTLKPYRTEWMIYDEELKVAGSIDMVYENPDGTLSIYDWKRCKAITEENTWNRFSTNECLAHVPDTNFWHYALQLNTYRAMLEKTYDKKVTELFLVQLHPECANQSYNLIPLPLMDAELASLIAQRRSLFV